MKNKLALVVMLFWAGIAWAQPARVILMEFQDQTGVAPDTKLGGAIAPGALAAKGMLLLAQQLLGNNEFVVVDRRDFLEQMAKLRLQDGSEESCKMPMLGRGKPTPVRPSFLQAAQSLNADVVLRGNLVAFSTGKEAINQGGYQTDFTTVSLRVMIEALDAVDGTVVAVADGVAKQKFRQTVEQQTFLSEDDAVLMFQQALAQATPQITKALQQRIAAQRTRPKVKLSVTTSADPAMVEIDGILVGSTPLVDFEVYQGDHVLAIGKPGYQDVTKRILLERPTRIEVPMIKTQLSAEQLKEMIEKMRLHVIIGEPALVVETIKE